MEMSYMAPVQALIRVNENSQVGEARRTAARLAELSSLGETDCGKISIIATELANNLVRHTNGGELLIRCFRTTACEGVELLSVDRGPGMADVGRCMEDGFSTGGTAGTGLGAIRRLSTEFDIYSARPAGTVVLSRVLTPAPGIQVAPERLALPRYGIVRVPAPGETMCGDNWAIAEKDGRISMLIADGLGHGPLAAKAADEAVKVFDEDPFRDPGRLLDSVHGALRSTRGAAVAIMQADLRRRAIKYVGVGNIAGSLIGDGDSRGLFSHNGTVGLKMHKIQEFDYPWPEKTLLVMHSDGLQTRWDLAAYPGLPLRHPAVIAAVLYRDFSRIRDDLTVAVIR
ncbi:MAG TPA: ATP-binding protein [Tepidisphaeraceae bacterium]|jgi:anti-sigma regulatory factor (Ser/Thr protein kinase)|nr:ATP-binding protein [Tepidisphaeraceae bacterium]